MSGHHSNLGPTPICTDPLIPCASCSACQEGPSNGIQNPPSRMHNQAHVWIGGTMLSSASPNDPAFFYHHANVDRLYQRWLENSGQLYAGGEPSAVDYPAQLIPLMNNACKVKYPDFRIYLRDVQGVMTLEVSPNGNNSVSCDASCLQSINGVADWDNEALTEARDFLVYCMQEGAWGVSSEAKTQLFTGSAQALHFVLAWPEDDVNAATIPPVDKQFLDPHVFRASLPLAGDPTTIIPHTYESFTLAGAYAPRGDRSTPNSSVFLVEPTMVDRVTQIALAQPDWLSRLNVSQPPDPDEVRMVAIAVDNAGFKLNLKGWTTTHYWGPGLVDQLITSDNPVTVSFEAEISQPMIRCADFKGPDGSGLSKCETLNSPIGLNGDEKAESPWQQLVGQQQLMTNAQTRWENMTCYNTTELREQGFVLDGALHLAQPHSPVCRYAQKSLATHFQYATPLAGTKTPEQFTPADADFCLITFTLLASPFLNATSLKQRNEAVWDITGDTAGNGQVGQKGATTFVAPRLDRPRSWYNALGSQPLDVTEIIYIGAHPGHNKQAEDPHTHAHAPASAHAHAHAQVTRARATLVTVQLYLSFFLRVRRWFGPVGQTSRFLPTVITRLCV
jgi:hypothetical protein